MRKKIRIRDKNFMLTSTEVKDLLFQLQEPSKFVALGEYGQKVAEGNTVEYVTGGPDGVQLRFSEDPDNTWWFFGGDHYTIVTRPQYEALMKAGLAK